MFEGLLQPMHLLVIVGIALLVFGPKKLPELGKGLGDGIRGFRSAMREIPESTDPNSRNPEVDARMSDPVLVFASYRSVRGANRVKISTSTYRCESTCRMSSGLSHHNKKETR